MRSWITTTALLFLTTGCLGTPIENPDLAASEETADEDTTPSTNGPWGAAEPGSTSAGVDSTSSSSSDGGSNWEISAPTWTPDGGANTGNNDGYSGYSQTGDDDNDGVPDDLEFQLGTSNHNSDSDGDGLQDGEEIALGLDPANNDTDGDNLSDGLEVNSWGTDPLSVDTDNDGLTDYEESHFLGTSPKLPDTDLGGATDGVEVALGSNPFYPGDDPIGEWDTGL